MPALFLARACARAIPAGWLDVLAIAASSRAAIFLVAQFALGLVPRQALPPSVGLPPSGSKLLDAAWLWDGGWYGTIARLGYHTEPPLAPTVAFWPLFPRLVRLFGDLVGGSGLHLGGVLIPLCAYLAALFSLHRLVCERWGPRVARRSVLLLSVFPSAFFFSVAYPSSLLLLCTVACFAYARRGRWWLAGGAGLLAALADVSGVLLVAPLACEYARQRPSAPWMLRWEAAAVASPILGLGLFMAYLQLRVGDALAFVHAAGLWKHHLAFAPATLLEGSLLVAYDPFASPLVTLNCVVALLFLLLGVGWLVVGEAAFGVWILAVLGLHLTFPAAEPMDGIVRYVLPLFPGFIALGLAAERWRRLGQALLMGSLMLLGLFTALFFTNHWVA